jgi:AcrR family transcriptional regulator
MAKRAEYLGPERRRPLVLAAARTIFSEGGFADASMSAIADRAGVSKAVLYDCFPGGKQEIYYALLDSGEEAFMAHMLETLERTNTLPLEQALREGMLSFVEYAEMNPESFRLIFGDAGTSDPEIAKRAARTKELLVAKMGERTTQILTSAGVRITPAMFVYNRSMIAVWVEIGNWVLRDDTVDGATLVGGLVPWFMRGFENIIPGNAWREPAPELS